MACCAAELFEALKEIDLSNISPQHKEEQRMDCNYWWLNANPKIWSFADIEVHFFFFFLEFS